MVNDPRVTGVLSRLGGVYRDPARVDRDTASLLGSSVGAHLAPNPCPLDGITVLTLQGTIAMHFKGNTYQLLMDIFLPPRYPNQPPACFVRLASSNMYLKANHKFVDSTGKVYLPYLHEWNRSTHNLIELVVIMSSVFSNDPPVFTRAPTSATTTASAVASETQSSSTTSSWQPSPPPTYDNDDTQEAILQVAIAQANEAAETARRMEAQEREAAELARRQAEAARLRLVASQAQEQEKIVLAKSQLDDKVRRYLLQQIAEMQTLQQADARDETRLEWASEQKIKRQLDYLTSAKKELTQHLSTTEQCIQDINEWLEHAEAAPQEEHDASTAKVQVVPLSSHDAQLLDLEATNASLTDALYFLDRALYQGQLDCEQHLKHVRQCAKQQFLVRAHMIKIQQKYGLASNSNS
jgi:ESCRT-I complex subunit TSG101